MKHLPRYPVYVPSKGRHATGHTAKFLIRDQVPFRMVVEAPEHDAYAALYGEHRMLVLPFVDRGLTAARNWIKDHSIGDGHARHWQIDDNIVRVYRMTGYKRIPVRSGIAFAAIEDFVDRYTNVAIAGMNYTFFAPPQSRPPVYFKNCHVYSCSLIYNIIPHRWRPKYNDDTDLCLQVLSDGWCTIATNVFLTQKLPTMVVKGGNTSDYTQIDGRLRMANSLAKDWPHVVKVTRRFQRPQHNVKGAWRGFDTPLQLKPDIVVPTAPNEYGMTLTPWDHKGKSV